jgi:hypothetical protein
MSCFRVILAHWIWWRLRMFAAVTGVLAENGRTVRRPAEPFDLALRRPTFVVDAVTDVGKDDLVQVV